MRTRVIGNCWIFWSFLNIVIVGCDVAVQHEYSKVEEVRPTYKPCQQLSDHLIVVNDSDNDQEYVDSQYLGFQKIITHIRPNALNLQPIPGDVSSKYLVQIDPSEWNHANASWVQSILNLIRSHPARKWIRGIIIETASLSSSEISSFISLFSAQKDQEISLSISIPLGMLAHTIQIISGIPDMIDGYIFYQVTDFWIPKKIAQDDYNPFILYRNNATRLFEFLTTSESPLGSPIPERDLDALTDLSLPPVIVMFSLVRRQVTRADRPTVKPSSHGVLEFASLSRETLIEFKRLFQDKYKINFFGINSSAATKNVGRNLLDSCPNV